MDAHCQACDDNGAIHLLRFPQWQGSDAPAHLAGGRAAASIVEQSLRPSGASDVPVETEASDAREASTLHLGG